MNAARNSIALLRLLVYEGSWRPVVTSVRRDRTVHIVRRKDLTRTIITIEEPLHQTRLDNWHTGEKRCCSRTCCTSKESKFTWVDARIFYPSNALRCISGKAPTSPSASAKRFLLHFATALTYASVGASCVSWSPFDEPAVDTRVSGWEWMHMVQRRDRSPVGSDHTLHGPYLPILGRAWSEREEGAEGVVSSTLLTYIAQGFHKLSRERSNDVDKEVEWKARKFKKKDCHHLKSNTGTPDCAAGMAFQCATN
eukprot:760633-Hanusia_phi.AAC.1